MSFALCPNQFLCKKKDISKPIIVLLVPKLDLKKTLIEEEKYSSF